MTKRHASHSGMPEWLADGAPGPEMRVPDDGDHDAVTPAPATGSLATSGRDDQERGDTVSGLGLADVGHGEGASRKRGGVAPGPQSGAPTPGNRYPEGEPAG